MHLNGEMEYNDNLDDFDIPQNDGNITFTTLALLLKLHPTQKKSD